MRQTILFLGAIYLLFTSITSAFAQQTSEQPVPSSDDLTSISLPPLDLLFENAKSAPVYQMADVKTMVERKMLAKEKRAALSFFSIRGSYQYGMFGNEGTYTDVSVAPMLTYSTQAQLGYTLGVGLNVTLEQLFDLKSRVTRQRLNLKSAELEREVKHNEVKKEIIELYTTACGQLNVLRMRSEHLVLASVQYEISEKNFSNGTIESSDLAVDKERQSQSIESFEKSKFELTKSLLILEVIANTPIIKK